MDGQHVSRDRAGGITGDFHAVDRAITALATKANPLVARLRWQHWSSVAERPARRYTFTSRGTVRRPGVTFEVEIDLQELEAQVAQEVRRPRRPPPIEVLH